jgi:hypothetical protein
LVALLLVGCSRDNPWFVLNTAGAVDSESSQSGTLGEGSSHGETGPAVSSSGDEGSTAASTAASTSSMTSTTTTTGEPETSSTSTSDSGLASSSDGSTGTDGTTGEPGEEVLLDLYEACNSMGVEWGDDNGLYGCNGDPNNFPSVAKIMPIFKDQLVNAIVTYPLQAFDDYLNGTYQLDITGATHPYFHTIVWIPVPADPTDVLIATVFTESDNVVPPYTTEVKILAGIPTMVELDLQGLVGQLTSVALHLQIKVVSSKVAKAKAYWINPKVIDLP